MVRRKVSSRIVRGGGGAAGGGGDNGRKGGSYGGGNVGGGGGGNSRNRGSQGGGGGQNRGGGGYGGSHGGGGGGSGRKGVGGGYGGSHGGGYGRSHGGGDGGTFRKLRDYNAHPAEQNYRHQQYWSDDDYRQNEYDDRYHWDNYPNDDTGYYPYEKTTLNNRQDGINSSQAPDKFGNRTVVNSRVESEKPKDYPINSSSSSTLPKRAPEENKNSIATAHINTTEKNTKPPEMNKTPPERNTTPPRSDSPEKNTTPAIIEPKQIKKESLLKNKQEPATSESSSESSDSESEEPSMVKPINIKKEVLSSSPKPSSTNNKKPSLPKAVMKNTSEDKSNQKTSNKKVNPPESSSSSEEDSSKEDSSDKDSSEEDSSEDNSSEEEEKVSKKSVELKKKLDTNDDVVCMGEPSNITNLIDDESDDESEFCLVCKKEGHPSNKCKMKCIKCTNSDYETQVVCKCCGETYGSSCKSMPKPMDLFALFSQFMQFYMNQNQNRSNIASADIKYPFPMFESPSAPILEPCPTVEVTSNDIINSKRDRKRRKNKKRSRMSRHSDDDSDDSDSTKVTTISSKKRKKSVKSAALKRTQVPVMQPMPPFGGVLPTPFSGFNTLGYNPMMAFSQMMGYNPAMNFKQ